MTQIMLNLIAGDHEIHQPLSRRCVDAIVAALSADPEKISELEAAIGRFMPYVGRQLDVGQQLALAAWQPGICLRPTESGIVFINLTARLIVWSADGSAPKHHGCLEFGDDLKGQMQIWFCLSPDWEFTDKIDEWRRGSDARRRARAAIPRQDSRHIIYGEGVRYIVKHCIRVARRIRAGELAAAERVEELLATIHADWLRATRRDLLGAAPRDVLLDQQDLIDSDLQSRRDQWNLLDECPVGLDRKTAAFQFAGYGTHEIVLYYDLFRHLLHDCWRHVADGKANETREAARLRKVRDEWLHARCDDVLEGYTPAAVIDSERRRVPLAVAGETAMIDCDCPLCQMMAESGPVFLHLDGCHMDAEYVFSFHRTEEAWRAEQTEWKNAAAEWDRERASPPNRPLPKSPWQQAFWSEGLSSDASSPEFTLIAIAACLAELGLDLKQLDGLAPHVQILNRQFGNLREVARSGSTTLLQPVVDRFRDQLQDVCDSHPDFQEKCHDLQKRLDEFVPQLTANR